MYQAVPGGGVDSVSPSAPGKSSTFSSFMRGGYAAASSRYSAYIPKIDTSTWSHLQQSTQARLASLKPWATDFLDRTRFSKPTNFGEFQSRLSFNVIYFQNNYILIALGVTAYFLITNIWLLMTAVFLIVGFKWISNLPSNHIAKIGQYEASLPQLWLGYGMMGALLFWISSATSTILYLAGVLGLLLCAHGGMMEKPMEASFGSDLV